MTTGTIAVIMVFSIPIIAILADHFQKQTKLKHKVVKDQLELEKLKHENFMLETEKMRQELEIQLKLDEIKNKKEIL
ncbi:hypothetical protein ACQCT6_20260 [Cytobacillus gottheilii]|uniref:Uncharacterized protein n=1 Tax=Cytobacillus gottheilii TaxID=859144 RepID=A0ABX8FHY2_9BACI|nr:hypothetical protein [Cytobacillus gottheilii]QVY63625.1 hypothetical protein J1899_03560 [Cytobacillus gottheilii]